TARPNVRGRPHWREVHWAAREKKSEAIPPSKQIQGMHLRFIRARQRILSKPVRGWIRTRPFSTIVDVTLTIRAQRDYRLERFRGADEKDVAVAVEAFRTETHGLVSWALFALFHCTFRRKGFATAKDRRAKRSTTSCAFGSPPEQSCPRPRRS